jgi:hypothetical protein
MQVLRIRSAARFRRGQVSAAAAEEPTVAFEKSWEGGVEVRPATWWPHLARVRFMHGNTF